MPWFSKDVQGREFDPLGKYQEVQYLAANPNASGFTQLVAPQPGLKIIVLNLAVMVSAPVTVSFYSGNGTKLISTAFPFAANGGIVLPYSKHGWFSTNVGDGLYVNLNGAVNTAIQAVWYPSN